MDIFLEKKSQLIFYIILFYINNNNSKNSTGGEDYATLSDDVIDNVKKRDISDYTIFSGDLQSVCSFKFNFFLLSFCLYCVIGQKMSNKYDEFFFTKATKISVGVKNYVCRII